mmetsp:Transcript_44869/g.130697  ORF Transcript_44869/g.130697 Transcript_44869/m.130697 type:complete len:259 (+) Transcript_44869:1046-1822(+)
MRPCQGAAQRRLLNLQHAASGCAAHGANPVREKTQAGNLAERAAWNQQADPGAAGVQELRSATQHDQHRGRRGASCRDDFPGLVLRLYERDGDIVQKLVGATREQLRGPQRRDRHVYDPSSPLLFSDFVLLLLLAEVRHHGALCARELAQRLDDRRALHARAGDEAVRGSPDRGGPRFCEAEGSHLAECSAARGRAERGPEGAFGVDGPREDDVEGRAAERADLAGLQDHVAGGEDHDQGPRDHARQNILVRTRKAVA